MLGETEIPQKMEVTPGEMEALQKVEMTLGKHRVSKWKAQAGNKLTWCFRLLGHIITFNKIWGKAFPGLSLPTKNLSLNLYGKIRVALPTARQALKIIEL